MKKMILSAILSLMSVAACAQKVQTIQWPEAGLAVTCQFTAAHQDLLSSSIAGTTKIEVIGLIDYSKAMNASNYKQNFINTYIGAGGLTDKITLKNGTTEIYVIKGVEEGDDYYKIGYIIAAPNGRFVGSVRTGLAQSEQDEIVKWLKTMSVAAL